MSGIKAFSSLTAFCFSNLILITCLVLASALPGRAQAPGSSRGLASGDGINMIQGRVHFPSGQSVGTKQVKVSLESVSSFGSMSTVTDQDGVFRFRSLQAGGYTIVVDAGDEYEKARESVNIDREASPGGRTVQVAIQLHLKVDASNPAFAGVPQNALNFYQKAAAAEKKGDTKAAVGFLESAISSHPNFPAALSELGLDYMKLLQWEKASATYETLLKLKPTDGPAHLDLGISYFNLKKFDEAETHLRKALSISDVGPTAHYYLGLTLVSQKRYDEAQKEFELTISKGGDNLALAHKYLGGIFMSSKKNQQAADELEKYLKLDPKAPDAERIKGTIKDLRSKP
jgi:tetratricopeptide (TPR) repeat protein